MLSKTYLKDAEYWRICADVCTTDIETKARCLGNEAYCKALANNKNNIDARKEGFAEYRKQGGNDWS